MTHTLERRRGFTLIEILVVMAIIAVLVSLTTAAVMRYYVKGPEISTRSDITRLAEAHGTFCQTYNVSYIPSRIVLLEAGAYDLTNPLHKASSRFLQKVFGRRVNLTQDWNNSGGPPDGPHVLEGQQCLVFFLGGIPSRGTPNGCLGFADDPRNPALASTTARKGPFFPFQGNRLVRGAGGFFSYRDGFERGNVYAYFSAGEASNGYSTGDCASLGLVPYHQNNTTPIQFYNPDGFQIISAGSDALFGAGGYLDPGQGTTGAGANNMTNFSQRLLGAPVN